MSKTIGIVAEYNPFHKGHLHQLECVKQKGFDTVAVAMSGSCVQRGEFGFLSKYERAKYAIDCGASLVCEIPYPYSSQSAEGFAKSGVHILKNLGVDAISFGSESADTALLCSIADFLLGEEYETLLKKHLRGNVPFATARERAILEKFDVSRDVIAASNDILALEYIKECKRIGWDVEFVPVKRKGANYNDTRAKDGIASATHIRKCAGEYRFETAVSFVPEEIQAQFLSRLEQGQYFVPDSAFEKSVLATLKKLTAEDFAQIADCNRELSHAFENAAVSATGLDSLYENLPTKQYTRGRLNRIILAALVGKTAVLPSLPPYVRIVAMDKKGEELVKKASVTSTIPISHSCRILQDKSSDCAAVVKAESLATDLQQLFFRYSGEGRSDYTTKLYKK